MAKILIINLPAHGHVIPTIELTRKLILHGHEITYLITEEFRERIAATGATVICYDHKTSRRSNILSLVQCTKAAYTKALEIGAEYDFIFYEMIFGLGRKVGKMLGKPTVALSSFFAINKKVVTDILDTLGLPLRLAKNKGCRRLLTKIFIGKDMVKDDDIISEMTENTSDLNIIFTSKKIQLRNDEFDEKKYKFVGPSIIDTKQNIDIPFDKIEGKIIYISMGATNTLPIDFFKKCIQAFIGYDATIIMSVGENIKIDNLRYGISNLGAIPVNIMIFPFVSQLDVLQHADLFITHGGMDNVNEAIYYGVPVIVIPEGIDQLMVANRIAELGLGKRFKNNKITAKTLRKMAAAVLENPSYKEAIDLMSVDMKTSGGYEQAVIEIEKYIQTKATSIQ